MRKIFLVAAILIHLIANAGLGDSSLNRLQDQIIKQFKAQVELNKEREKQGLPKDFIVKVMLAPDPISTKWINVPQNNTNMDLFKSVWNFEQNTDLIALQNNLTTFSQTQQVDYYVIVAAI